jgi:FkbM family methyltransferase
MRGVVGSLIQFLKHRVRSTLVDVLTSARLLPYKFGIDPFQDIKRQLGRQSIRTIFDVGANKGETALVFRAVYPSATIHCFEPNSELSGILNASLAELDVHTVALSSKIGEAGFDRSKATSDLFSLTDELSGEIVRLETIDNFCLTNLVGHIDYLKIDTEGHDLEVLRGAAKMLADEAIDIVQAEVSMNPDNRLHVGFLEVQNFLQQYGYRIFGIYEQISEWPTGQSNMRRANVVYISQKVMKANEIH